MKTLLLLILFLSVSLFPTLAQTNLPETPDSTGIHLRSKAEALIDNLEALRNLAPPYHFKDSVRPGFPELPGELRDLKDLKGAITMLPPYDKMPIVQLPGNFSMPIVIPDTLHHYHILIK